MSFFKIFEFEGRGGNCFRTAMLLTSLLPLLMEVEYIFRVSMKAIFVSAGGVALIILVLMIIGAILEK